MMRENSEIACREIRVKRDGGIQLKTRREMRKGVMVVRRSMLTEDYCVYAW
jgi:hypothetical protein